MSKRPCERKNCVNQEKGLRESSFNMTRVGNIDIEGELRKFIDTLKGVSEKIRGDSENVYTSKPKEGRGF